MAHVSKYKKGDIVKLINHYNRARKDNGDYYEFKNQSIDKNKTYLNYDLHNPTHKKTVNEIIEYAKAHSKRKLRDDYNLMCNWVVTLPKNVKGSDEKRFFNLTYKFLSKRYGVENKSNIISANVHLDETTPHMHFAFVPIDKKGNISAKNVLTKNDLKYFHQDLQKFINLRLGYSVSILSEEHIKVNKTITELKNSSILEKHNELKNNYKNLKNTVNELENKSKNLKNTINQLENTKKVLINSNDKLNKEIEKVKLQNNEFVLQNEEFKLENSKIISKNQELKTENNKMISKNQELKIENKELKSKFDYLTKEINSLSSQKKQLLGLQKDYNSLLQSKNKLKSEIEEITSLKDEILQEAIKIKDDYDYLIFDCNAAMKILKSLSYTLNKSKNDLEKYRCNSYDEYTVPKKIFEILIYFVNLFLDLILDTNKNYNFDKDIRTLILNKFMNDLEQVGTKFNQEHNSLKPVEEFFSKKMY